MTFIRRNEFLNRAFLFVKENVCYLECTVGVGKWASVRRLQVWKAEMRRETKSQQERRRLSLASSECVVPIRAAQSQ